MNKSESIAKLTEALCKVQGEIKNPQKDKTNPFYKSKYADLASVWDSCRFELSKNGLAVIQGAGSENSHITIETMITHISGEWISSTLMLPVVKNDPQGYASSYTYGKRIALTSMIGITPENEDDDGESAIDRNKNQYQAPVKLENPNEKQLKLLWVKVNEFYNKDTVKAQIELKETIQAKFNKTSTKDLSSKEISELIKLFEKPEKNPFDESEVN